MPCLRRPCPRLLGAAVLVGLVVWNFATTTARLGPSSASDDDDAVGVLPGILHPAAKSKLHDRSVDNKPEENTAATTSATKSDSTSSAFLDEEAIPVRTPTGTACQNVKGIYHIAMGDIGGAAGTIFFQFVIAQILYAERQGLKPWVHLSNVSNVIYDPTVHGAGPGVSVTDMMVGRNATYYRRPGGHRRDATPGPLDEHQPVVRAESLHFDGTGVWEHYFEPVSDFVPGDRSCTSKLYVTMDLYLITPGLHGYADYAPRCWRYKYQPDYITKVHLGMTEWLEPQRQTANRVIQNYIHPRPYLKAAAAKANPDCSLSSNPCLGLHIRHSDKASGRRVIETFEFLPYAQAFLEAAAAAAAKGRGTSNNNNNNAQIYLATDSTLVLQEIEATWPEAVRSRIRTAGEHFLRSSNEVAVFDLKEGASQHHRTNQEVLVEIIALSSCQFMVHGYSAVSEAAIWMELDLHEQSVNLEDPDRLNVTQFERLVQMVLADPAVPRNELPRPIRSRDVWPELFEPSINFEEQVPNPTNTACEGYDGVLHISAVGKTATAGKAFFTSVLNQLVFAKKHNLKPWVHLRSDDTSTELIYDDKVHSSNGANVKFEMLSGMAVSIDNWASDPNAIYPDRPGKQAKELSPQSYSVQGNGIWNSYFEPVSDFIPGDESCRNKPLIEMEDVLVSPGMDVYAPWSIRAWRYDNVPESLWWKHEGYTSLKEWYAPMRTQGHLIVKEHYRFRPFIQHRAEQVNPVTPEQPCLGVHLRNGEKFGEHRSKIAPQEFEAYVQAFEKAGGQSVYVASDSHRALQNMNNTLPERLTKLLRSQGPYVVRSTKLDWPAHYIEDHHRVNSEVLVDVLALSKCSLLLHGFSTVSEAAIYLNPSLHERSVNLEDPSRISPAEFEALAREVVAGSS